MKRMTKWTLMFTLAGPATITLSCSSIFIQDLRDAILEGATIFARDATTDALDLALGLAPAGEPDNGSAAEDEAQP